MELQKKVKLAREFYTVGIVLVRKKVNSSRNCGADQTLVF